MRHAYEHWMELCRQAKLARRQAEAESKFAPWRRQAGAQERAMKHWMRRALAAAYNRCGMLHVQYMMQHVPYYQVGRACREDAETAVGACEGTRAAGK